MSCPECDGPLMWAGMRYEEHSQEYHQGVRRRLYGAVSRLLAQETRNRLLEAQAASQGRVGVRSHSGVYRGLGSWSEIPREVWDAMDHEKLLKMLRSSDSAWARMRYGVVVNPATWIQKVYDSEQSHTLCP